MPLDTFVPAPVTRMEVVGDPEGVVPIFARDAGGDRPGRGAPRAMQALERFAFYAAAKAAFCDHPHRGQRALWLLHPEEGRDLRPVAGAAMPEVGVSHPHAPWDISKRKMDG